MAGISIDELKEAYETERDPTGKLRLLAALHRKEGESIDDIVKSLHKPRRTVHGWLRRFESRGIEAVHDRGRPGRPRRLTDTQLRSLRNDLIAGPEECGYDAGFWSTALVQEHVRRRYGVSFVQRHMTRLLHKMGFSPKKPRQRHYKAADEEAQKRFKKKREGSSATTQREDTLSSVWTRAPS